MKDSEILKNFEYPKIPEGLEDYLEIRDWKVHIKDTLPSSLWSRFKFFRDKVESIRKKHLENARDTF